MKIVLLNSGQKNGYALELETDDAKPSVLSLRSLATGAVCYVVLQNQVAVPRELLVETGKVMQLATLAEIRAKVARAADMVAPAFNPQHLEATWLTFVTALSTATVDAQATASFLNMQLFADGATDLQASVRLNLNACLLDASVPLQAVLEITAMCAVTLAGAAVTLRAGWRLTVSAEVAVPRLAILLPGPQLRFPTFDLPDFDLARLAIPGLPDAPQFDMALPALPGIALSLSHDGVTLDNLVYRADSQTLQFKVTIHNAVLHAYQGSCSLGSPTLLFGHGAITITGVAAGPFLLDWPAQPPAALPAPLEGLVLQRGPGSLAVMLDSDVTATMLKGYLTQSLSVYPATQPDSLLTLEMTVPFQGAEFTPTVTINGVQTDRSVQLLIDHANLGAGMLLDRLAALDSINLNLRLPALSATQVEVVVNVLSAIVAGVASGLAGLAGLARTVEASLRTLFDLVRRAAAAMQGFDLSLVFDARSGHLQQLVLGLRRDAGVPEMLVDLPALSLTAPGGVDIALLVDLRDGQRDAYLVTTVGSAGGRLLELGSDLWFAGAGRELQTGGMAAPGEQGPAAARKKLIELAVIANPGTGAERFSFIPFGIRHGEAVFFYALAAPLPAITAAPPVGFSGYQLRSDLGQAITATAAFDIQGARSRILPFLSVPKDGGGQASDGLAGMLKQYIELETVTGTTYQNGVFDNNAVVKLHVLDNIITSDVKLQLDARRMTVGVKGGLIQLTLSDDKPLELLGMKARFVAKDSSVALPPGEQFVLDLGGADTRMYLNDAYRMELDFDRLGLDATGRPLRFDVTRLVLHGTGMDLEAGLAGPYTLRLNGLETDFTFEQARIQVRGGRIEAFSLGALGKLPPALMGDVDVRLQLDFGERKDGSVGLLNGAIELKNCGKPIRNEQTQFVLTLEALSVRVFDDGGGLHFCTFISGSAKFAPETPDLAQGMLKNLAGVELRFTDCPVSGASEVIERELEKLNLSFVVALDEPVKASLFDLFSLEVRSIGFEPRCKAFDGTPPAIVIGGQVMFAATGDIVRAECDFHKLYLATPAPGKILPRLKCEGLGLALKLGNALEIEGKVVAVDGRMPSDLLVSVAPDSNISGNGFKGQGRVAIQGLPPFAASFGFVEIAIPRQGEPGQVDRKLAWFVYLEAQRLSYHFQLGPVPIYLREAGLGLGYHFTYVGIEAIDNAPNLVSMIKAVDTIAATALQPARAESWTASRVGDPTLVGRLFISMSSASAPSEPLVWKASEEKELPNLLLLNMVAALRKSTFVMTANVWLGFNYHDWQDPSMLGTSGLAGKQAMTGYVLLAGARNEFLARVKSNPGAQIGTRLPLPSQFVEGLKKLEYDATLYIRPGLLHFELGWPNRIRWSADIGGANLNVAGGAIFRVHEGALLVGLNLEGSFSFSMSARLDAGCVGIAVSASVYAALVARIIGYLDSQKVDNSLYYSLFSLQIQVRFEVSAWLEIDAWLCKITIRVSFALQLQLDVVAELALQGNGGMGTRVRATIAVSIFGRSLGLSVGFSVNPALVDEAAARVGRYMNLGLLQEVPSVTPDIGRQDEDNEALARRGQQRLETRIAAAVANAPGNDLAKVPDKEGGTPIPVEATAEVAPAVVIGATDFQIILTYPKVAPAQQEPALPSISDYVYLTFLPLDAAPAVAGGLPQRSAFYAAPQPRDNNMADHTITFDAALGATHVYRYSYEQTSWLRHELKEGKWSLDTRVKWDASLDYNESTQGSEDGDTRVQAGTATMENLFFAAFRTTAQSPSKITADVSPYMEPMARPLIHIEETTIERLSQTTQQQYDRQETNYNLNLKQAPADRRCHEARDFLIQKFVSDLFELAGNGLPPVKAHALHTGLTLLVPRTLAESLSNNPGWVKVGKRVADLTAFAESAPCTVFNPPGLMFSKKPPRFSHVVCRFEDNRACLDWDLRWDHSVEPEYFVQHYELTRWIEVDGIDVGASTRITFKRADQVAEKTDGSARQVQRGAWQFTDEFQDMTEDDKGKLFNPVADVVLRYTVVPVCVSGTRGRPCSDFIVARTGTPQLAPIRRASVIMTVDPVPHGASGDQLADPVLRLRIESGDDLVRPDDQQIWRIIARAENIMPAGQYGSDGQTERALGSAVAALRTRRLGDEVYVLNGWNAEQQQLSDDGHVEINAMVPDLIALLGDTANPRAYTLMLQSVVLRQVVRKDDGKVELKEVATSALALAELGIEVLPAQGSGPDAPRKVMTRVDALELVRAPLGKEAYLLDPVAYVDLHATGGRAVLREPTGAGPNDLSCQLVLHPDFGGVTQLSWDVRPSGLNAAAIAPYRLLSGFDIYGLDLDRGDLATAADAWAANARPVASARLLSAADAQLTPTEVGEPSNWKVRYPSQAERRRSGGAWYSPAESRIVWPRTDVRREPLPEPSSELIKTLLRNGIPAVINVSMTGGTGIDWDVSLPADPTALWQASADGGNKLVFKGTPGDSRGAAVALRQQLRRLRAIPKTGFWPQDGMTRDQLRGWKLELQGKISAGAGAEPVTLAMDEVPMYFDRELHPLLEAILVRMRRRQVNNARSTERLLDVDRRPAPVLSAKSVAQFIDATGPALDPYGWAMLDRLGLGVTVRLFDPVDDVFLSHADLHAQLAMAVNDPQLAQLYPEAMPHLFVEELLQPGGMMSMAAFADLPDSQGIVDTKENGARLRRQAGLSMVRLSLRPVISKELQYRVWTSSADATDDSSKLDVDYFLPQLNETGSITGRSLKDFLIELENRGMTGPVVRKRFVQPVFLRGKGFLPGSREDNRPGGELDVFGRFSRWMGWDYRNDFSLLSFTNTLRNALGPEREGAGTEVEVKNELEAIIARWEPMNARFFDYAAVPGPGVDAPFQYALAAVEPSDQLKVAPNSAGQITVLLPETDGYAHHRAFAVLPQWRYARLLADAGHRELDELMQQKRAKGIVSGAPLNCYAIAAIERTAPVQPPEVLAVARLGDQVWWSRGAERVAENPQHNASWLREQGFQRMGTDPGDALPVVMRHHPELLLSKSNITPARGLALAGSLTSFVLTPTDQAWCAHFLQTVALESEYREDIEVPEDNQSAILEQVTAMLGQVPAGSRIRVLRYLPHWYRHAVALSAGAGRAVAETVSAYLADSPARLVHMNDGIAELRNGHSWSKLYNSGTIAPMPVEMFGKPPLPGCELILPALLYRDTTDAVTAALWAGPMADLPDPGVCYDLALESEPTALRMHATSVPLARITRGALSATGDELAVFPLTQDWHVACTLASDAVSHLPNLLLSFTPMSEPVAVVGLEAALAGYPYLHGTTLRVPGGWSAQWLDHLVAHGAEQDPIAHLDTAGQLWEVLAGAGVGMPSAQATPYAPFLTYGLATFKPVAPATDDEWKNLGAAMASWLAALAKKAALEEPASALAALLLRRFTPINDAIGRREWSAGLFPPRVAWLGSLPMPQEPCAWLAPESPRTLVPELMTDSQYQAYAGAIGVANPALTEHIRLLRQRQRQRAMAGGALRIRATRGDAIALELPLIPIT